MALILLVEDNELNRDMLSRRLKRAGHEVLLAVDGQEAVTKALGDKPDIVEVARGFRDMDVLVQPAADCI